MKLMKNNFKDLLYIPDVIATFEDMQAIVTVWEGVLSLYPAAKDASLAMFEVLTSWITVP